MKRSEALEKIKEDLILEHDWTDGFSKTTVNKMAEQLLNFIENELGMLPPENKKYPFIDCINEQTISYIEETDWNEKDNTSYINGKKSVRLPTTYTTLYKLLEHYSWEPENDQT